MNKTIDKNVFKGIMDGILGGVQKETLEKYPELINALTEYKDADDYHMRFQYPIENVLESTLQVKYPKASLDNIMKLSFIYQNYRYVETFINKIIVKYEGLACSADKSMYIMREFERFFGNNKPINTKRKEGDEYWMPKILSENEWLRLFDCIYHLAYGSPIQYMTFVKEVEIPLSNKILKKIDNKK